MTQKTCSLCGRGMVVTKTRLPLCVVCDTDNRNMTLGLAWPDDYLEWSRGMAYPEPYGD